MNKKELIDKLIAQYEIVLVDKVKTSDVEAGISHCSIPVFAKKGDCLIRQWIHFYVNEKDEAFWSERCPIVNVVEATPEQIAIRETLILKNKAIALKELVELGLEDQTELDKIKVEYDALKIK